PTGYSYSTPAGSSRTAPRRSSSPAAAGTPRCTSSGGTAWCRTAAQYRSPGEARAPSIGTWGYAAARTGGPGALLGAQVAGGGDVRVRPVEGPGRRVRDRHSPADRIRLAAHRFGVLVHAHRSRRAVPTDARQGGVLPDGLGRQRTPDRTA